MTEQSLGSDYAARPDRVVVDLSPMRSIANDEVRQEVDAIVATRGAGAVLNEPLSSDIGSLVDQTAPAPNGSATERLCITSECLVTRPIWDLPVLLLTYDCTSRASAKELAKELAAHLCVRPSGHSADAVRNVAQRRAHDADDADA